MNKNGFTLIELLAVILILSLLTFLAVTSVTKVVRNSKEKLYDTQILSIKKAAESWGASNLSLLPEDGECIFITLRDLKDSGLLDENLIDPITNELMEDSLKIRITSKKTPIDKEYYEYEITEEVTSCSQIYE